MSNKFIHCLALTTSIVLLTLGTNASAYNYTSIPSATFASTHFWQLNRALAIYQKAADQPWETIPSSPSILKVGTKSKSVLLLREHLRLSGDLSENNDIGGSRFDHLLSDAVKNFQIRHGLKADGAVGRLTREELNIPLQFRIKQIALNLERWAELAAKVGDRFIMINIPDFKMYLIENNQMIMSLKTIVGKPELPTPQLASKITRIILNPYWNIPNKIARNDIAPKMLEDPSYMYRLHIRVINGESDYAKQVNPQYVDWSSVAEYGTNYHLRQDPGPENALGLVKFEFQNSQSVYMHDTSARNLFATDVRDYSHGCIRLENPFALVRYLMKDDPKWSEERIQNVVDSGQTKYINIPKPIPIFIAYFTAWVDDSGYVNFRNDVYQLDQPTLSPTSEDQDGTSPWQDETFMLN